MQCMNLLFFFIHLCMSMSLTLYDDNIIIIIALTQITPQNTLREQFNQTCNKSIKKNNNKNSKILFNDIIN